LTIRFGQKFLCPNSSKPFSVDARKSSYLPAISNNAGFVKGFLSFFPLLLILFEQTTPLRFHERSVATAECLASRERGQGRSGGLCRTVHRQTLEAAPGSPQL